MEARMGKVRKVSIALTEDLAETVRAAVASGDFGSAS
jgi:Arc/MetJ-type ribon-helix-helix transcriptional regulator